MNFSSKRKLKRFFDYACKTARLAHDLDWLIDLFSDLQI